MESLSNLEALISKNINVIMYIVIFCGAIFFCRIENKDIHCPNFGASKEECDQKGGMAFSYTKPEPTDTCKTLINKIYKASGAEQASVKWRRALCLSVAIMGLMWILIGCHGQSDCFEFAGFRVPEWRIFYISVLVSFAVILGSYLYYSYHVFGVAESWIKDSIKLLEEKGCIRD
jgi:hypothetical protein